MKSLRTTTCILALAGCAAMSIPPATHHFKNFDTFGVPYNRVWQSVLDLFAEQNWPVERMEKDAGVIVSEPVKDRMKGGDYSEGPHTQTDTGFLSGFARFLLVVFAVDLAG